MPAPVNRAAVPRVDGWLGRLGRIVCRPRCLVCGEPGAPGRDLCQACTDALPWNLHACPGCALPVPPPVGSRGGPASGAPWPGTSPCPACIARPGHLAATHAAFLYAFPLDRLLPRFKFHHDLAAGRLLAGAMADAFAALPPPEALVPVPLHVRRLRSRGYDQALELARPIAVALGLRLRPDLLHRQRHTAPQSRLDGAARRANLRGAFGVPPGAQARPLPRHVALVDDVMTTGATLHAAAAALHAAGVARVDAWICARVP